MTRALKIHVHIVGQPVAPFEFAQAIERTALGDREVPGLAPLARSAAIGRVGDADQAFEGEVAAPDLGDHAVQEQAARPARFGLRAAQPPLSAIDADEGMAAMIPVDPLQRHALVGAQPLRRRGIEDARGFGRGLREQRRGAEQQGGQRGKLSGDGHAGKL